MKQYIEKYNFSDKLNDEKDFPKIKNIPKNSEKVPKGKLITINELRKKFEKKHKTTTACPIVACIYAWIAAYAAEEDTQDGKKHITPYLRTLKSDGKINEKYPGSIQLQKRKLSNEDLKIYFKGKNYFVEDFTDKLSKL